MQQEWPLVGRQRELAEIEDARVAGTGGLLLAGPAGVGKTRLAQETAARNERRDVAVRWVRATRATATIPLAAFAPLLPREELEGGDVQLRRAADALRADAGGERFVLVVDDVQWLDETSAALLLQLVVLGSAFVVATLRTGEEAPDAVTSLWKEDLVDRMEVQPLTVDEVTTLLGLVLGDVESSAALAFARASGGNPLYLRELVLAALDQEHLRQVGGLWLLRGDLPTSPRLHELVTARLRELDDHARRVLELVAVAEPIGLARVEELAEGDAIEQLERRGLVDVYVDGRRRDVRVAHAVYSEVVRASMTSRRYREICRAVAEQIERFGARRRADKRRVAMFRLDAGQTADVDQLLAAAHASRMVADYAGTERFARAALDAGGGARAGLFLGEVLDEMGRHDDAEHALRAAAAQAVDEPDIALIGATRADNLFRGLGRAGDADAVIDETLARLREPSLRAEVEAQRAINTLFAGRVDQVFAITEPMLASSDLRVYSQAALPAAMASFLAGRYDDAVQTATRAFEARVAIPDELNLADAGVHLVAMAFAQAERGDLEHAAATALAGYRGAADMRHRNGQAYFAIALARVHLLRGDVAASVRYAREAALLYGEFGHPGARWGWGALALASAHAGDVATAEAAIADLDAEPETPVAMMDADIDRARAWVVAARGELPRARTMLLATADRAGALGQHGLELAALFDVARLSDAPAVLRRLDAVSACLQGQLAECRLRAARALASGDGAALERCAEEMEACGALLWAAELANEAAIVHRAAKDPKRASVALERAGVLTQRCEGARTPGLRHGTDTAVLTRREREIATLAAQGLSSREIAESLTVSPRTVENHLQRAYEKLGVRGRAELADALARASL